MSFISYILFIMNPPFLIATGNQGKFKEILSVLQDLPYDFLGLHHLPESSQIEENGLTHDENAFLKARHFFKRSGHMTLAEDSGLHVDALENELGLHTRRWGAGPEATDQEWLDTFLQRIQTIPESERTARFVCSAVLIFPDGREFIFRGETPGHIMGQQEAPLLPGLPLSSVFKPEGFGQVYAAMSPQEKTTVSHRGFAVKQVKEFLFTRL